jgi:hypothetical protein
MGSENSPFNFPRRPRGAERTSTAILALRADLELALRAGFSMKCASRGTIGIERLWNLDQMKVRLHKDRALEGSNFEAVQFVYIAGVSLRTVRI